MMNHYFRWEHSSLGFQFSKIKCRLVFFFMFALLMTNVERGYADSFSYLQQEEIAVTGKVTDANGMPLPGVTVREKGTSNGTQTDFEGDFELTVSSENAVLVFSYVGMVTFEQAVGSESVFNVELQEDQETLEEVVVVGYGTQKKATLSNAVSSVDSEEIVTTKNENVQNMLTGKVAGLRVVQNSSEPGSFDNDFDIRGFGSPLIVIDGVPRDNISRLNPNTIESVSVLKDASAAIYGVRAANGVVLITTKKGKDGDVALSYSGSMGWQVPSGLPRGVGAVDFMTLYNERQMHNVNGGSIAFTEEDFAPYLDGTLESTDWYSPVIKDAAPQTQHDFSATGGGEKVDYYFNLGYTSQEGFLRSGDLNYERFNVVSNVTSKIAENFDVSLNINAIADTKNQPYESAEWIIRSFWRQLPTQPIYANNNPNYLLNPQVDGTNPVALSDSDVVGYRKYNNKWFQSSVNLDYEVPFLPGLSAGAMFSYDYNMSENKFYRREYDQYTYNANEDEYLPVTHGAPSTIRREFFERPSYLTQVSLNYERTFADVHNVDALLLYEESKRDGDNFFAERELSLPVDELLAGNSENQIGGMFANDLYEFSNKALVGRINYNYKTKYIAQFSFRNDGSSKFGQGRRWGFFPSGSLAWRVSEEGFWQNSDALSFITNFKLRGSYGELGDDSASSFQFITGYLYPANGEYNHLPPGHVFDGSFVNSLESLGLPNPYITWFISETWNFGVDADLRNGLLGATVDVFRRDRSGLLATRNLSLPNEVGADLPEENLNGDRTEGIEVELSHRNTVGDFSYNINANFAYTRTKNTYVERARSGNSYENWRGNSNNRYNDARWGYGAAGQFQSYDDIINSPVYVGRGALPGDYAYEDWNGDGQISDLDVHPIAYNGIPRINFGMTFGADYKGIDLNMLFQGSAMANVSYEEQLREPLWGDGSGLEQFMDRWHPVDPTADPYNPNTQWVPGHFAYTGTLPDVNSDYNIQDASYVRLKSAEIGYTFPSAVVSTIGIDGARIYANGYNLLTFSEVDYVDPEHPSRGWGYLYPLNKIYSVGINVEF